MSSNTDATFSPKVKSATASIWFLNTSSFIGVGPVAWRWSILTSSVWQRADDGPSQPPTHEVVQNASSNSFTALVARTEATSARCREKTPSRAARSRRNRKERRELFRQQFHHERLLFLQLVLRRRDLRAAEVI